MSEHRCKKCGGNIRNWFGNNDKPSNGTGKPGLCQRCSLSQLSQKRGKK